MDGKRARNVATSASVRPADQTVARPKPEGCGAEAEGGQPNLLSCNHRLAAYGSGRGDLAALADQGAYTAQVPADGRDGAAGRRLGDCPPVCEALHWMKRDEAIRYCLQFHRSKTSARQSISSLYGRSKSGISLESAMQRHV